MAQQKNILNNLSTTQYLLEFFLPINSFACIAEEKRCRSWQSDGVCFRSILPSILPFCGFSFCFHQYLVLIFGALLLFLEATAPTLFHFQVSPLPEMLLMEMPLTLSVYSFGRKNKTFLSIAICILL